MFIYESKDGEKEVEVESASLITADSELAIFLSRHLQAIHAAVPLTNFVFTKRAGTDPAVYDYVLTTADIGHSVWRQALTFLAGNRVRQTFNTPEPGWELPEFILQRPLRDLVIKYVFSHGVTKIEVTW